MLGMKDLVIMDKFQDVVILRTMN